MLLYIILALAALVSVLLLVVATRPPEFRISRTTTIAAPPSAVFPHVNDLHRWKVWSPWARLDPNATEAHEGAPAGVGAVMRWSGNNKVGAGSMTITASRADERIEFRLDFLRPMKATNSAQFEFKREGDGTRVTWTMNGCNSFMGKLFGLIMNMDKLVGGDFERGLAQLKAVVEAGK